MTARHLRQMNQPAACVECGGYEDPTLDTCPECDDLVCDGCLDKHLTDHEELVTLVDPDTDETIEVRL